MSRMKELRLEKQLTQRQLAEKSGVIPRYIGFLERAKENLLLQLPVKFLRF